MGNTIEQNIKVKEIFDVSEALKGIKQIQDALSKLALDPNTKNSFNKLFDNMERQAERASAAAASGFKNKGDVKVYTNAMDQIVASYDRIINKIEVLKTEGTITLDVDTSEFKQVNARINELKKNLDDLENKMSKSLSTIDKIEGRRGANGTIKSVASWQTAINEFKNGNIQKATAALRVLKGLMTKASNNGVDFEKDKTWKAYKKDYEELTKAINDYNTANQQYKQDSSELATKDQRRNEILEDTSKLLDDIENATKESAQGAKEYTRETEKAAKDTQQLNSQLENFKSKAAYFFGISNAINLFKRAVRSAYNTVKDLDAVMTETAVVTNFDVGDMWSQLPEYTQRANELGVTIHDTYEAATLFYQQGLKTNEVMQISNETLKMARIAGLDAATASDRMTNALRGFNMELDKTSAQRVNDVYSKLAAITASNTDEISTAMTKVASLAHNANMEFETTAAFLAQIIESTRESAETAGTALKTVVARFSEVKKLYSKGELLGQDEEGEEIDVNKVSTALRSAGINLNEYLTGAKGLDDIFIELAEKWDSLDQVQQRYIATMAAGSRQQSRFIALMSDYKRTAELVEAANNANGASQEQYGKTLDSLQTKLARLKNAWNEFILGLANSNAIKGAIDLLTGLITTINNLIKAISGKNAGVKMITTFFTAFTGFKIGQKIFGATPLGTFFEGLVKTGNGQAKKGAFDIAKTFYSNLSDKIVDFKGKGGFEGVKEKFANSIEKGWGEISDYFSSVRSDTKLNIWEQLSFEDTPEGNAAADKIWGMLQDGETTVGELNQALTDAGQSFQITEDNAKDFGIVMEDNNSTIGDTALGMKIASAACVALGAAMIGIGTAMEDAGGDMQVMGSVIKVLGAALTTFGTIMSVYLPLQAQLMARGVTGAIVSIPIVGIIAGIIAALTALGVAIYDFSKNYSTEARLEKATEAAKEAAEAANEAKEAYEELGKVWDDLDAKSEAIESATKGTKEWKDAVKELNDAVLELMNTYEGVEIKRNADGILEITNKKQIEDRAKTIEANTAAAQRLNNIETVKLELQKEYEKLGNELSGYATPKFVIDELQKENRLKDIDNISDEEIEALLDESRKEKGTYWIDPKVETKKVRDYAEAYKSAQDKIDTESLALGSAILTEANIDRNSQKYANTFLNNDYLENLTKQQEKIVKGYNTEDLQKEYAKAHGYDTYQQYKDDNPDDKADKEKMIKDVVGAKLVEEGVAQVEDFVKIVESSSDAIQALFAAQEGGALTQEQAFDLQSQDWAKLYDDFGKYMFDTQEAFDKWLSDTLTFSLANFDTSNFSSKFTSLLNEELTGGLTSGTFKNFVDNLSSVWTYSGEEGVKAVQESIKNIKNSANMSSDELENFINAINSVNWSSAESIATLDELASEYGISEDAIKALENQIIDLNKAVRQVDLEKLTSGLALAKKISSGEQGRSFTEEQYNTAITNGANKKDFIFNIETENYDYIGDDILDVRDAIISKADEILAQLNESYGQALAVEAALEGGSAESGNIDELRNFIGRYITAAGDNAIVDWDFFYSANLEQLQEVYDRLMQEYGQRYDTQAQIEKTKAGIYQTKSGGDLGGLGFYGDEQAKDTLKQQIANSGLPQAIIESLYEAVESGDQEQMRAAGGVIDTVKEASQFGVDAETLASYVEILREVNGLEELREDTLYELALLNTNYEEGFKNVLESYEDWIELEKEDGSLTPEKGNQKQIETYKQLKKDLQQMFSLTKEIPDDFFESAENAELLKRAVDEDLTAITQLRANLAKIDIGVGLNDNDAQAIYDAIDELVGMTYDLEFGAVIDDTDFVNALVQMLIEAGKTVDEINEIFTKIGLTPPVETEEVPFTTGQELTSHGYSQWVDTEGNVHDVPIEGEVEVNQSGMVSVPVIGETSFVPPSIPSYTPKSSSSGGGGGGGKSEKPSYWENPYDELYNLQEKINEALRTREALERRYQKLLKQEQATLRDIRKAYYDQITHLSSEADLQKQMAEGRLRQIKQIGEQMYTDSEGDRTSFSDLGVTKYASYNEKTGLIQIDWDALEEIANDSDREEEGKAAEAYISKLEELVSSYEEVRDKLWEIEDTIEQLREEVIESYLSFEDRVMEALVNKYQEEIDNYQAINDALTEADNEIIDSLREQIDLSRQIRDNTEKEQDITDMENRLAYLQRDTSGANDLEILKLQKDLDKAREDYTDTLIDQAIDNMQKEADLAAEQRARQIDIMQTQLDIAQKNGELWDEVWKLINDATDEDGTFSKNSELSDLLKGQEAFKSMSEVGKAKWWEDTEEAYHKAMVGLQEAEDKYNVDANGDGEIYSSGTSAAIEQVSQTASTVDTTSTSTSSNSEDTDKIEAGIAMAICNASGKGGWGDWPERQEKVEEKGYNYYNVQSIVDDIVSSDWDDSYYRRKYGISDLSDYFYSRFKTGGLANFTGPAWLDGTKTKPELVLNAQDTQNFITLKDILASLLNGQTLGGQSTKGGDNYFDIDITATLESDYDVDKLTEKIKKDIYNDGQYRNVNTINFLR